MADDDDEKTTKAEYVPLPDPAKDTDTDTHTFTSDKDGLEVAAITQRLRTNRLEDAPETIEWKRVGPDGKRLPDNRTVKLERSARDLTEAHRAEAAEREQVAAERMAEEVDAQRLLAAAELAPQPQPQPQDDPQPQHQPQHQPQPQQDQADPELERALAHPRIQAAVQQAFGNAELARQQFAQATLQAAQIATASVYATIPELAGIPSENIPTALQLLAQRDPARFAAVKGHLDRIQWFGAQHQQVQQAIANENAQRAQVQFQNFAAQQDEAFDNSLRDEPPEQVRAVKAAVVEVAEVYGVSRQQLAHLWATSPVFRDVRFQRLMYDAARYHVMLAAGRRAVPKGIPPAQRPGVRGEAPSPHTEALRGADEAFRKNPSLKNAAKLLGAKRAAGR